MLNSLFLNIGACLIIGLGGLETWNKNHNIQPAETHKSNAVVRTGNFYINFRLCENNDYFGERIEGYITPLAYDEDDYETIYWTCPDLGNISNSMGNTISVSAKNFQGVDLARTNFDNCISSVYAEIGTNFMPWPINKPKLRLYLYKDKNYGGTPKIIDVLCPNSDGTQVSRNCKDQTNTTTDCRCDGNKSLGSVWNDKISSVKITVAK